MLTKIIRNEEEKRAHTDDYSVALSTYGEGVYILDTLSTDAD